MARPRTPSKVLDIRGAFKKNPQRKRLNEPMPIGEVGKYGIGTTNPSEIWDELVSICPPHVLKNSDRFVMEIAVEYLRQFRESPANYSNERIRILISLLGKFGMTPSDRAKLSIPEANKSSVEDPWAKFVIDHPL